MQNDKLYWKINNKIKEIKQWSDMLSGILKVLKGTESFILKMLQL